MNMERRSVPIATDFRGIGASCTTPVHQSERAPPYASALPRGLQVVTDLSNVLRQEAAQCRRLAELVTEQTFRQELMEMAARLQAIADEIDEP